MSLFDTLRCDYPLPDPSVQRWTFHTQDLRCLLDQYRLDADGRLTRLHPKLYNPRIKRAARHVPEPEDIHYHGDLRFQAPTRRQVAYVARFTHGIVEWIRRVQESGFVNDELASGPLHDSETGLHYWGARYYDPKTGRGLSPDRMSVAEHVQRWQTTMGMPGQPPLEINPYAYVANNPLRWTDPTGHIIGAGIARILGRMLGRTSEESAYGGKILDVAVGAAAGDMPNCVAGTDTRTLRDLLRGIGGASSISLSISTTYGLYGAGATISSVSATTALPLFLSGYGGREVGLTFNSFYERYRGNSLGSDIYDLLNE